MGAYLRVAASQAKNAAEVAAELREGLGDGARVVLFFASAAHDMRKLAPAIKAAFPSALTVGCTTCGEVGPLGCTTGAVSAVALGPPARASAVLLADLAGFTFEQGAHAMEALAAGLRRAPPRLNPNEHVFVTLTDGLSGIEEKLLASLGTFAPGLPLVGGSAADDFHFAQTWVALDGEAAPSAAAVILLEPNAPFHAFHLNHFQSTETRLVVTRADPERRVVHELDGWPASAVLARLLDVPEADLQSRPLEILPARAPTFGFRVADATYMRSVMTVLPDGALLMGGAVEEGTILRVMTAGDLVARTGEGVRRALGEVPNPAGLLLFNCGGRFWEAQARGVVDALAVAMSPVPAAGFTTYGEQYGPIQVNHTLTGLVFGHPDE